MAYDTLLTETGDKVLTITLNRPAVYNAIDERVGDELGDALEGARRDDGIRAIVITGAGKAFCSGQDLERVHEMLADGEARLAELVRRRYNGLIRQLRGIEKPIVAAVNGVAAGAGMSLALACDLRIASENASFVQAFVNIGLVPDSGSLYFLPRLVGMAKALELCMLGDRISARDALDLGLVNRVVPGDALRESSGDLARRLATGPTKAIGLIKRGLNRSHQASLEQLLEYEALLQETAGRTSDFREGVTAFKEKRPARFAGI